MELSNSKKGLFVFGLVAGLVAVILAMSGNPKNMAISGMSIFLFLSFITWPPFYFLAIAS